jgi:hypothetical protein
MRKAKSAYQTARLFAVQHYGHGPLRVAVLLRMDISMSFA